MFQVSKICKEFEILFRFMLQLILRIKSSSHWHADLQIGPLFRREKRKIMKPTFIWADHFILRSLYGIAYSFKYELLKLETILTNTKVGSSPLANNRNNYYLQPTD
jgi:hypothetical protein